MSGTLYQLDLDKSRFLRIEITFNVHLLSVDALKFLTMDLKVVFILFNDGEKASLISFVPKLFFSASVRWNYILSFIIFTEIIFAPIPGLKDELAVRFVEYRLKIVIKICKGYR